MSEEILEMRGVDCGVWGAGCILQGEGLVV